jgi:methionine sulfoxide reductase heme-binding subunit
LNLPNSILTSKWTKVVVFIVCLAPLGILVWRGLHNDLTANAVQFVEHWTGDWTIRFLIFTLAVTPLRKILKIPDLIRFRRMVGLFAFFYGCLHFATWIALDRYFNWPEMLKDIAKRPFITVGFAGFVLMIPLASTSTAGWIRRLGGKRWQMLHRAIYFSAILGVIHYYWQVKSDVRKPLQYAFVVGLLLAWRIGVWIYNRRSGANTSSGPGTQEPATAESHLAGLHT